MIIRTSILAALVAVTGFTGIARASDDSRPTREVYVGDLNLLSSAGRAEMERRVKGAAYRVCMVGNPHWTDQRKCRTEAIATARAQMAQAVAAAELRAGTRLASR